MKVKRIENIVKYLIIAAFVLFFINVASAQGALLNNQTAVDTNDSLFAEKAGFDKSGSGDDGISTIVSKIISMALSLLGAIFIALMIMGGYQWMTAGGNEESVKKAKGRITAAIIGLVIVLAAYSITWFIFTRLPFAGGGAGGGVPI